MSRTNKTVCICGEPATRFIGHTHICEEHYKVWLSQRCQGEVFDGRSGYCRYEHRGTDRVEGKLYCWQHVEQARRFS